MSTSKYVGRSYLMCFEHAQRAAADHEGTVVRPCTSKLTRQHRCHSMFCDERPGFVVTPPYEPMRGVAGPKLRVVR